MENSDEFKIIDDPKPTGKPIPRESLLEWAKMFPMPKNLQWHEDDLIMRLGARWPTPMQVRYSSVAEAIRAGNLLRGLPATAKAFEKFGRSAHEATGSMFKFRQQYSVVTGYDRAGDGFTTVVRMRRNPDGTTTVLSLVQHPDAQFPRSRGESAANHLDRVFRTVQRGH